MYNIDYYLSLLKKKDLNTYYHSVRVAHYSYLMGKQLKYTNEQLSFLVISALLHDIGKLYIPNSILKKPNKLSNQEFLEIKKHTLYFRKILKNWDSRLLNVIATHHERLDGSGYPYHRSGYSIPYYSQILAVTDSFDAMTSNRNYNQIKSYYEAIYDLWNCSTQGHNLYNYNLVSLLNQVLCTDNQQKIKHYSA